jgi:hypothetical protein
MTIRILHLTRSEKEAVVAALCITHPEIKPSIDTEITVELANETLSYPGILDLLRLVHGDDTIIGLLTLIRSKEANKVTK